MYNGRVYSYVSTIQKVYVDVYVYLHSLLATHTSTDPLLPNVICNTVRHTCTLGTWGGGGGGGGGAGEITVTLEHSCRACGYNMM